MFKILCLDGGGARGFFTAYILKRIEEEFNIKINEYFDLIIGTSTGAIIGGSLAVDVPLDDILYMFQYENENIFQKNKFNIGVFYSIYSNNYLKSLIEKKLDGRDFKDCKTNLMITCTDIEARNPKTFKSWEIEDVSLSDAILASSAAPVYFDPYKINSNFYSDGCLWANNPSLLAISNAVSKDGFNKSLDDIKILSIGTGRDLSKFNYETQKSWGLVTFAKDLISIMIDSSDKSCLDFSSNILGANYLRIDYNIIGEKAINKIPSYLKEQSEQTFLSKYEEIEKFIIFDKEEIKYNFIQRMAKKIFKI